VSESGGLKTPDTGRNGNDMRREGAAQRATAVEGREGGRDGEREARDDARLCCVWRNYCAVGRDLARMAPGVAADGLGMVQGGNTSVINVPYIRMDTTCLAS